MQKCCSILNWSFKGPFRKTIVRDDLGLVDAVWWRDLTSNGGLVCLSVFLFCRSYAFFVLILTLLL